MRHASLQFFCCFFLFKLQVNFPNCRIHHQLRNILTDTENSFSPVVGFFTNNLAIPPSFRVRQVPRSSASSMVSTSIGHRSPEYLCEYFPSGPSSGLKTMIVTPKRATSTALPIIWTKKNQRPRRAFLVLRDGPAPPLVPGRALSEGRTILFPPGQPRKPSEDSPPLPS